MNRIPATVHGVDGDTALVETENAGGCGRCNEPGGCRSGLIAGMFAAGRRTYRVANTIHAQAGERVLVCLPEGAVLRGAIAGYLVPVLGVVVGAALGHAAGGNDPATALGAMAGLGLGLLLNRWRRGRDPRDLAAPHLEPWNGQDGCGREHS